MRNNLILCRVNIDAFINLVKLYQFVLKILSGNEIMTDGMTETQIKYSPTFSKPDPLNIVLSIFTFSL